MFLNENKVVYLSNVKDEDMDYERIVQDLDLQSENVYEKLPLNEGRKRMRLHQLTWEEKLQRKKLRNRIAAQTSRDRKKAKMDHLEESVKSLKQQNNLLIKQVEELIKRNELLVNANKELQKALAQRSYTCACLRKAKEEREIVERSNEVEEQICVEDEMLADFKGDTFLDDLERLASSLLEEVEQNEVGRNTESVHQEVSGISKKKCTHNTEVVGKTPKKLESSRSDLNLTGTNQQQNFQFLELTAREKTLLVSSEHSYAAPGPLHFSPSEFSKLNCDSLNLNVPIITIAESDRVSATENELKKDIELKVSAVPVEGSVGALTIPNSCSPRSEVSSDQGYESLGSPYESEISKGDFFDELNDLWSDTFSELFPELM